MAPPVGHISTGFIDWLKTAMRTVGAFEAKTHLSALLDAVAAGEEVTITRHGKAVARLVPAKDERNRISPQEAVSRIRERSRRMRLNGLTIREMIDEGRE